MISATISREQPRLQSTAALRSHGTFGPTAERASLAALVAEPDDKWIILKTSASKNQRSPEAGSLDSYGLWKTAGGAGAGRLAFEVPVAVSQAIAEEHTSGLPGICPRLLAEWAHASLQGEVPPGWTPPSRDLLDIWMPPGSLTLQVGPLLRRVDLILAASRWALQVALVPSIPAELPRSRLRCLQELAAEAQQQWRLVRVCLVKRREASALMAGVDLTGAPHSEPLFLACLDGLRHVAQWLAETADLLADVTVTLRSPEVWQTKTKTRER